MKILFICISSLCFSLCLLLGCSFPPPPTFCNNLGSFLANGVSLVRELPVDPASASDLRITSCEQAGSTAPACVTEVALAANTVDAGPDADGGTPLLAFGRAPFEMGSGFLRATPDGKTQLSMFLVSADFRRGNTTQLSVTVRDGAGVELMSVNESVRWSNDECAPSPDRKEL